MALSFAARGRVSRLRARSGDGESSLRWWHATHVDSGGARRSALAITASGTQLSLAVAAGLMAWYLIYFIGVHLRFRRYEQRRLLSASGRSFQQFSDLVNKEEACFLVS
jgi:hypothetical protein